MIPEWMLLMDMTPEEREDYARNSEFIRALDRALATRYATRGAPA